MQTEAIMTSSKVQSPYCALLNHHTDEQEYHPSAHKNPLNPQLQDHRDQSLGGQ